MPLVSPGFLLPDDTRSEFGYQVLVAPPNPGLGATFSRKTPGAFYEILLTVSFGFTTSVTAADRQVFVEILDGDGRTAAQIFSDRIQTAFAVKSYIFSINFSSANSSNLQPQIPLFPLVLVPGYAVRLGANQLQADDEFKTITFGIQQFNTGVEPERFTPIEPVETGEIGLVVGSPLATLTPSPAQLPSQQAATAPSPTPTAPPPAVRPAATPAPIDLSSGAIPGPTKAV